MSVCRVAIASCLVLLSAAGTAFAQNDRTVGLVMGVPVQLGVLWHASDRVAVRPDVSFSWSASDIADTGAGLPTGVEFNSSSTSSRLSAGVAVLFYLSGDDGLRTYVAPRYAVSRSASSNSLDLPLIAGPGDLSYGASIDATQTIHSGGGLFGASCAVGSRFTVFGEIGLDATSTKSTSGLSGTRLKSRTVSTRGGVGVVVYF